MFSVLIGCIEGLVELFNKYAFTQVAVYGKPYCRAAKDTLSLLRLRGLDIIISENLTQSLLLTGGFLMGGLGVLGAFVGGLIMGINFFDFSQAATDSGEGIWVIVILIAGLILGLVIFNIAAVVIESGQVSTIVCLAEEPDALYRTKPELYERIKQAYPNIVVPVRNYV